MITTDLPPPASSPLPVQLDGDDPTGVAGLGSSGLVAASAFRANYVVLSRQEHFIGALRVRGGGGQKTVQHQ